MPLIRNFGRNIAIRAAEVHCPATTYELRPILEKGARLRCRGSLHSWSPIIDTEGALLDLGAFDSVEFIDGAMPRVRVGAGCTLSRLLRELRKHGRTLPTLGANDRQTVAGAVATGTHGSGKPSLSHFVEKVTLLTVNAQGRSVEVVADSGERLLAARCALGALGVVVELQLAVIHRYRIKQSVRKFQSLAKALAGWNDKSWPLQQFALMPWSWTYVVYRRKTSAADGWCIRMQARLERCKRAWFEERLFHWLLLSVLFVARWRPGIVKGFLKRAPGCIKENRHVDDSDAMLILRHDRVRYVEMEIFIPEARIARAVGQLRRLVEIAGGEGEPVDDATATELCISPADLAELRGCYTLHYPLFFRRVDTDDTLVSMASRTPDNPGDWITVSVITYRCEDVAYAKFCRIVAQCMIDCHQARLHWGKFLPEGLADRRSDYPAWQRFEQIRRELDPTDRFRPALVPNAPA